MTLNYKPSVTKFGIKIDLNAPLHPSVMGLCLLFFLHFTACCIVWWLNWPYLLCLFSNVVTLGFMMLSVERSIFSITRYQLSFFFENKVGWVIQENENSCYGVALCSAFCAKYLVILIFKPTGLSFNSKTWRRLVIPIFSDSLSGYQFRQLRKVLITIQMAK